MHTLAYPAFTKGGDQYVQVATSCWSTVRIGPTITHHVLRWQVPAFFVGKVEVTFPWWQTRGDYVEWHPETPGIPYQAPSMSYDTNLGYISGP